VHLPSLLSEKEALRRVINERQITKLTKQFMKSFEVGTVHSPHDYAVEEYNEWKALAIVIILGVVTIGFIASRLTM
jgi:hypothetical protein